MLTWHAEVHALGVAAMAAALGVRLKRAAARAPASDTLPA
jgi:hypothetical protein